MTGRLLGVSLTTMLLLAAAGPALVSGAFHGVAVAKSTTSPLDIGDAYTSIAFIGNTVDSGHDTVRVTGLSDAVASAGGSVSSGPILATTGLVFGDAGLVAGTASVSCTGGSGLGTAGSPYIGATSCLLEFDGTITTVPFSHYTVQAADYDLPNHRLTDAISWNWNNTCVSDPDNDCTTAPQVATAGASALILPAPPPGGGQITHTNVSCADFLGGVPSLTQLNYRLTQGNVIRDDINPGKFFFWTEITTTVPNQVVTVSQTNTSTNNAAKIKIHQGWARIYTGSCSSWTAGTPNATNSGASFTAGAPGTYVIGIKYNPKSLVGKKAPVPADITYAFSTSLGGDTGASLLLKKK